MWLLKDFFSCETAKAEDDLSILSCMHMYVEWGDPPGGINIMNFLISSTDLE